MRYRIIHTTEYRYGNTIPLSHNVIRLRPRNTVHQTCLESTITISPIPAEVRERVDFFGNFASWVSLQEPHEVLRIKSVSEVEVTAVLPPISEGPSWEATLDVLQQSRTPEIYAVREYTFDSSQVQAHASLADYARPSFAPGRPILEAVLDLTRRIFKEFVFDPSASTIGTPILDVLRMRRGVCQDFAHLQIGCLRSLGMAARYVSGYVLTRPPKDRPRLVGADASHAWISVFIPTLGWIDFDPTNGVIPFGEHITLGWARDYDDVTPVKGVVIGGVGHTMKFGVDVEPVEEPDHRSSSTATAGAHLA